MADLNFAVLADRLRFDYTAVRRAALEESRRLRAELAPVDARRDGFVPRGTGEAVDGLWLPTRCPWCRSQLTHETTGKPGLETRAVLRCNGCSRRFQIKATLLDETATLGRGQTPKAHPSDCICKTCRQRRAS